MPFDIEPNTFFPFLARFHVFEKNDTSAKQYPTQLIILFYVQAKMADGKKKSRLY